MRRARHPCLVLLVLMSFLLGGCSLFRSDEETPAPPTATTRPTSIGTPPGTLPPDVGTPVRTPTAEGPLTLVLWTSEDFAPTSETAGGMRLLEQMRTFQLNNSVRVDVILKKRSGPGGLLEFLTTASAAAPTVLPDLITLSDADLYRAVQAGLLQPLDELVAPEVLDDQFQFALDLTRFGGTTMGVLYQADLSHVVYDTVTVEDPPLSWREVYSSTVPFVFSPATPSDGINDIILIQYLAQGGKLVGEGGGITLEVEPLTQALEFFRAAQRAGVIPSSVLEMSDATTAWAAFRIDDAGMVQVPASLYLAERAGLSNAGFSAVPLAVPRSFTVGHGWALAMVTQDPARQAMVAALIEHLLSPENSGAWTQAAGRLPTRLAALNAWDQNDDYLLFIRDLLAQARPAPNPELAAEVGAPLAQALAEVLRGQATPVEAAQSAVETVRAGQ